MNINATLFGQMLTFAIFVLVTMKYVWPAINKALNDRERKIAEGLEAAERGRHELELAQHKAAAQLRDAKIQAAHIIDQANQRANRLIEDSKEQARIEGERLLKVTQSEIEQERQQAKQELMTQVATMAIQGASKLIQQDLDTEANKRLMSELISEISEH